MNEIRREKERWSSHASSFMKRETPSLYFIYIESRKKMKKEKKKRKEEEGERDKGEEKLMVERQEIG